MADNLYIVQGLTSLLSNRVSGEHRLILQCRMAIGPQGNTLSLMDLLMIIIGEALIVSDVNLVTAVHLYHADMEMHH